MTPSRRRRIRLAFLIVFTPLLAEGGAWCAGRVLQSKWAMYVDPLTPGEVRRSYEEYLALRDAELGWPFPSSFGRELAHDGTWPLPANAELAGREPLVALYGDSFTWGQSNSDPEGSWPNHLARRLGRPVKNWAVPAYGTDQAYLRFRRHAEDRTPVVVLGHMAADMCRNLTRLRDLISNGNQRFAFKPRFVAGPEGGLELVPLPALGPAEYRRLVGLEGPQLPLEHESFLPGGPTGAVRLEAPFTLAVARNCGFWRFQARVRGEPEYLPFYSPGHPLRGYEITRGILLAFDREARRRGQRPVVVLFPGPADAAWCRRTGRNLFDPLAADLRAAGVEVLDFTPRLFEWLAGRDTEVAFDDAHYAAELEPVVADAVLRRVVARGP